MKSLTLALFLAAALAATAITTTSCARQEPKKQAASDYFGQARRLPDLRHGPGIR
jgi:hypothetical protein